MSTSIREHDPARPNRWLPAGKTAAVCFSIDDVHPSTSGDDYEAGGDLAGGALGRLEWLQRRHPRLQTTLCVTPDWRLNRLAPNQWRRFIPWVRHHVHWTTLHGRGRFRLDRHPNFVTYLNQLPRCQIILHGLTHAHKGPRFAVEFQSQTEAQCIDTIKRGIGIFELADVRFARGYAPPSWEAPPALLAALSRLGFEFVASARDVVTPIAAEARTSHSGILGASLIYPETLAATRLVHISSNFQATSCLDRALQILELGGVLHIKAHIFKFAGGRVMLDGLDDAYCNYLDLLFTYLSRHLGDRLWWAQLSEVAARVRNSR
jgi:hypothetical protein